MRWTHWATLVVLAATVVPSRSFPCSPVEYGSSFVQTPWLASSQATVPTRPVIFSQRDVYLPEQLYQGSTPTAVEFAPTAHDPLFDRVDGLAVVAATGDLADGYACIYAEGVGCVMVDSSFDSSEPQAELTLTAFDKRTYEESGCGDKSMCGPTTRPRHAAVSVSLTTYEDHARIAGWFVEYGPTTNYADEAAVLVTSLYNRVESFDLKSTPYSGIDFGRAKQVCVQLRSVLWDATLGAPHDLGCAAFQKD